MADGFFFFFYCAAACVNINVVMTVVIAAKRIRFIVNKYNTGMGLHAV